MVTFAVVLAVLVVFGLAGITGFGTYDSRDTSYALRSSGPSRPAHEDRMAPDHPRRTLADIWADCVYAQHRLAELNRPWLTNRRAHGRRSTGE